MYDGSDEVARFPAFSPMRKLEIWCESYFFRRSLATVLPGGRRQRLNSGTSASFSMHSLLTLKPSPCKWGCTAADNSLTFGGFLPAAFASRYTALIFSIIFAGDAGFKSSDDRLGWLPRV